HHHWHTHAGLDFWPTRACWHCHRRVWSYRPTYLTVTLVDLRVWGLPGIFSQAASWKPCILLVSARLARNFVTMWSFGVSRRNSGSRWRSAVATTSSEGGIPGRTVRSHDPKEAQTSWGCETERYCSNPWHVRPVWMKT